VVKAERDTYQAELNRTASTVEGFQTTIDQMQSSLDNTREKLDDARDARTKARQMLVEKEAGLYEKTAQLERLEKQLRILQEEKAALEDQLASAENGGGELMKPEDVEAVTQIEESAMPAASIPSNVGLKGVVKEVNPSLVAISLGSADGVKKGMTFHVTRGENFLCDLVITNVDTNVSAGVLELVMEKPKVGDTVSTEL